MPTVAISQAVGQDLLSLITSSSQPVLATFTVDAVSEKRRTYNVTADSTFGNKSSIITVGAHSDSVEAGPGINDNGSGTIAILAVARAIAGLSSDITPNMNAVRFAFWSAEEFGLLGSKYYMKNLPEPEARKIKAYINCDMLASPNFVYGLLDGDKSAPSSIRNGTKIPIGSGSIERLFAQYFTSQQLNFTDSPFAGNSDYAPFADKGIPSGGVATGSSDLKTVQEAAAFGGTAGVAYDPNYHGPGDTAANLNQDAFLVNTRAVAHVVMGLIRSLGDIADWTLGSRSARNGTVAGRSERKRSQGFEGVPGRGRGCSQHTCPS